MSASARFSPLAPSDRAPTICKHSSLGALLICYLVGVFGPALDSHHASEWPQSQALVDAQRAAVREFHKDMAAAKLCRQEHGESSFTWTAAGELVCIPRHGKRQLASNP